MTNGFLTTHVLNTATGLPAAGLKINFYRIKAGNDIFITSMITNSDGRTDNPILPKESFETGYYKLDFMAGDYLRSQNKNLPKPLFLDVIPIHFGISDEQAHYHVPLLLSPFGYSTYKGS